MINKKKTPSSIDFKFKLFLTIPFFIISIYFLISLFTQSYSLWSQRNWKTTAGEVISSGNTETTSRNSQGKSITTRSLDRVAFSYEIENKEYQGETPANFSSWILGGAASNFPITEPKKAIIFYNPADPSQAVLSNQINSGFFVFTGITVFFCLISWSGFLVLKRKTQSLSNFGGMIFLMISGLIILPRLILYSQSEFIILWVLGCFSSLFFVFGLIFIFQKWLPWAKKVGALYLLLTFIALVGGVLYNTWQENLSL